MRLLLHVCVAIVAMITPVLTEGETTQSEALQANGPVIAGPSGRVARLSLVSGTAGVRNPGETGWSEAAENLPLSSGAALRTDARTRAELRIGADRIDLA